MFVASFMAVANPLSGICLLLPGARDGSALSTQDFRSKKLDFLGGVTVKPDVHIAVWAM